MKPLTKTLLSGYLASTMFLTGCASTSTRTSIHKVSVAPSKLEISTSKPRDIDSLIKATGNFDKSLPYIDKFNDLKGDVTTRNQDNIRKQTKSLVYDIERSSLYNRYELSSQVKDWGYYRYDKITTTTKTDEGLLTVLGIAILAGVVYYALEYADAQSEEEESGYNEDDESPGGEAILMMLGIGIGGGWLYNQLDKGGRNSKSHYRKVYYQPYYGRERVIDDHIRRAP